MLPFTLDPDETLVAPHGFMAFGSEATTLRDRVLDRPQRFEGLHVASGHDWTALFGQASSPPTTLPYLSQSPRYLYRVADGLFCEFGFKPDLPTPLPSRLGSYLRRTAGVLGPIALTQETDTIRLYDLGHALPLESISPPMAEPEPAPPEQPAR